MPKLIINGQKRLKGTIKIQGAKNSILPVLAGTVLCDGDCIIHNCPELSDVETSLNILNHLGFETVKNGDTVSVKSRDIVNTNIPDNLMREMRSSVVFLGAIIGRCKRAVISSPGGCELGPRPIDLHISALKKLGVNITEKGGYLYCDCENGLKGADITLSFSSVGATENVILAAATAEGVTVLRNAAKEPEIVDLCNFLNCAGGKISGMGSDTVIIKGVNHLHSAEHTIIPDRIVAVTYLSAAALTGGEIIIQKTNSAHIMSVIEVMREAGCRVEIENESIFLKAANGLRCVSPIRTHVYPGFPTDAGPLVIAMLSKAKGTSVFVENIFENRYRYIDEMNRFGTKIRTEGKVAIITGTEDLKATNCRCTDLRGGAALVLSALAAEGESVIDNIYHIKRGYEKIAENFRKLGADIKEVD